MADGHGGTGLVDEPVPGLAAEGKDMVVGLQLEQHGFIPLTEAKTAFFGFFDGWRNPRRQHLAIGNFPPNEFKRGNISPFAVHCNRLRRRRKSAGSNLRLRWQRAFPKQTVTGPSAAGHDVVPFEELPGATDWARL